MKLAERMSRIGIESAFEVLQRARALEAQGRKIVHLEIGQPDFPTPRHVRITGRAATTTELYGSSSRLIATQRWSVGGLSEPDIQSRSY